MNPCGFAVIRPVCVTVVIAFCSEAAAHHNIQTLRRPQNHRKWNVGVAPQVDVVRVCNVANNELPRFEFRLVV